MSRQWTKFSESKPNVEGWYIVHHSIDALPTDRSYWASMSYKALYWWPATAVWTESARRPEDGGVEVKIDVLTWSALNCLEDMVVRG